jgi:hypothetical protein
MNGSTGDATSALLRALRAALASAGRFVLEGVTSRSWASVTFTGARHEIAFRLEGEQAQASAATFLGRLSAAEFELRGHIVADIAVVSHSIEPGCARIRLEALTVEDC